jgi:hypothetical protein
MNMPGFSAAASLYQGPAYSRTPGAQSGQTDPAVISQLSISGILGRIGRFLCGAGCGQTYSQCLDTCEGTIDNPQGSGHCTICDQQHKACREGCNATRIPD